MEKSLRGKSKFKEAIGTVIGYCNGDYPNICRVKLFNEQMDKTVKEAKGEVEAFTQNKMHSLALDALKKDNEWIGNLDAQNKVIVKTLNNSKEEL